MTATTADLLAQLRDTTEADRRAAWDAAVEKSAANEPKETPDA